MGYTEAISIHQISETQSQLLSSAQQSQKQQQSLHNHHHNDWKERMKPKIIDPTNQTPNSTKMMMMTSSSFDNSNSEQQQHHRRSGRTTTSSSFDSTTNEEEATIDDDDDDEYMYIPLLKIRRQRIGEEQRFIEDPAIVDITVSIKHYNNGQQQPILPPDDDDDDGDDDVGNGGADDVDDDDLFDTTNNNNNQETNDTTKLLHKTSWQESSNRGTTRTTKTNSNKQQSTPCILYRRNVPMGFCDAAFSTSVLDRFPYKNYKGLPLPEEELPMFCYPTGCKLYRTKYSDAPLPEYYGFVVKNERGDSIYVSCVSFMEPLTNSKKQQLSRLSEKRRRVSLPHKLYWSKRRQRQQI